MAVLNKIIRVATVPLSLNILLRNQFKFLRKYYHVVAISSPGEDLFEVGTRENVDIKGIEIKRKISIINDITALYKLYVYFRKEKPLIVHSITPKAGLLSMMAAKLAGIPIRMHTFTGLIFPTSTGAMKHLLIWMDRLLCYCATNIYPEGQGVRNDLVKYNITKKPVKILANGNVNGIDLTFFDPSIFSEEDKLSLKEKLAILPDDFVFIFIGRLVKDKGINELIHAFKKLSSSKAKLLLVGSLEPDHGLEDDTLHEIKNNPDIISVGFQKDVRLFLAISDALVFPSYREGFPNVVMQAGAMGLPSIVTDINGSNEIIIHNENGIIIPPKNDLFLYESMVMVSKDLALREKLKRNARQMIADRYQQSVVLNALLEEYKNLEKNVQKFS
ncbi:glycosyltransferase family 4 protein [Chryseobacterium sp. VAUSW3]|uniref:glycosyltransferase family 4 protein n=1 Tax=Chryseobacterium sp. VAUSW3 TaxID=2010998 RepID=UPI000B4DC45E|nr:glycosyltransferase family 4 protein [Chryseobacterium sp. VAUSW3]OWR15149.1 glycosyltransferase family 1 protein [Chryseobacterium sp. VAUSW3]